MIITYSTATLTVQSLEILLHNHLLIDTSEERLQIKDEIEKYWANQ